MSCIWTLVRHFQIERVRRHLINMPARIATGARRLTLHLLQLCRWQAAFTDL
ncbi:hypothetical protein ACWGJX_47300 [Streptomyces sp. NPDC054775]